MLICWFINDSSNDVDIVNKLLMFIHNIHQRVNLNQQSTVKTAYICNVSK